MTSRENANVTRLKRIADPVERAAAAQEFLANGRATLQAVQQLRDDAIREARKDAHPDAATVDRLAARVKVRRNVVVDALRSLGRFR